jgi:hypothetical protein
MWQAGMERLQQADQVPVIMQAQEAANLKGKT